MVKVILVTFPKTYFFYLWFFFSYLVLFLSPPRLSSVTPQSPSSCHRTCLCSPPPGRTGQPVSHRGPPVPDFAERHLGFVSSRQPGAAGTVGTGQTFSGKIQSVTQWIYLKYPVFQKKKQRLFLRYWNIFQQFLKLFWCSGLFVSPPADVQSSLQQEAGSWGWSGWPAVSCKGITLLVGYWLVEQFKTQESFIRQYSALCTM